MSVTGMARPGLVVRLDDIDELFTAPAFDPLSAHGRSSSGIEEIVADLRTRSSASDTCAESWPGIRCTTTGSGRIERCSCVRRAQTQLSLSRFAAGSGVGRYSAA